MSMPINSTSLRKRMMVGERFPAAAVAGEKIVGMAHCLADDQDARCAAQALMWHSQ